MSLVYDPNHAAEALALLPQQYKGKTTLAALINANSYEAQLIENALNQLATLRLPVTAATGAQLDGIGDLVGRARGGMTDAQYLIWLDAQLLANISAGQTETLISIVKLITQGVNAIQWLPLYPKASLLSIDGELASSIDPVQLSGILGQAAAAGVNLQLLWSPEDDADTFTFAAADAEGTPADQGWGTVPGVDWATQTSAGGMASIFGACWGDGPDLWCLVGGSGGIETSQDGVTWTKQTAGASYAGTFTAVAFGGGLFVAGGSSGELQTSPDGITWTHRTAANSYAGSFNGIVWTGTQFVAVGSSAEIQTSPDGITWTHQTKAGAYAANFEAAAWSGSLLCIVGQSGEIQTSPDGVTWTHQTNAGAYAGSFDGVAWGGSVFCTVGSSTTQIQTSPDGVTWTSRSPAGGFAGSLFAICWDPGGLQFVICGSSSEIQTSPDGTTWTHQNTGANLLDAAAADGHYGILIGDSGAHILTSCLPGGVFADVQQC